MKIAFTGSHGTGKTTSAFKLCHEMKLEHANKRVEILHENAARAPKGLYNKKGTKESQLWIFTNQLRTEIELTSFYDIVICDRTIFDSIAYTLWMGFADLGKKMYNLGLEHIQSYDEIYFKSINDNNYLHDCEHRDTKDLEYRQNIEEYLLRLYKESGITNLYKESGITNSDKFKII